MFRRIGNVLMIVAVLAAAGTHWMILQSVAWTTMLVDNLHTESFNQAIVTTFDGKHPCRLCKQIANARQSEKKSDVQTFQQKLDFPLPDFDFAIYPPSDFSEMRAANETARLLDHAPATPPPKALLA